MNTSPPTRLLALLPAVLLLLAIASPLAIGQNRVTAADIQNAQRRAADLWRQGRYQEVVALQRKIYNSCRQVYGDRHMQTAGAAYQLAQGLLAVADYTDVEAFLNYALSVFRAQRIPNDPNVAAVQNSLGTYYDRIGQVADAERCYSECIRILNARGQTAKLSVVRYNMATMYRQVGLGQAAYARRVPDRSRALELAKGAIAWLEKARNLLAKEIVFVGRQRRAANDYRLHNRQSVLGEVLMDLSRFEEADRLFRTAKEFSDRVSGKDSHGRDMVLLGLSSLAMGRPEEALDLFRRANAFAATSTGKLSPRYTGTLALTARALAGQGKFAEAGEVMDRAQRLERRYALRVFPSLSESEQLSYLYRPGAFDGPTHELALALGAAGGPALAARSAEWLLNSKALSHELLGEKALLLRDAGRSETAKVAAAIRSTREEIAALSTNLSSAPEGSPARKDVIARLSAAVGRAAELEKQLGHLTGRSSRPDWIGLDQVRKAIPKGSVLVSYARYRAPAFGKTGPLAFHGTVQYGAWIVPAAEEGEVAFVDLGPARPIEGAILKMRDGLKREIDAIIDATGGRRPEVEADLVRRKDELAAGWRSVADETARLVLRPLLSHVSGRKRILLSPDAHLWLVPFSALPLAADGPLWIEKATITTLVSGRDLLSVPAAASTAPALVVGDVDYDAGIRAPADRVEHPAGRLGWSPIEVAGVVPNLKKWTGAEPTVLTGAAASEEAVKAAAHPRVLFLSTHGVFGSVDESLFRPGLKGLIFENPLTRCKLSLAGCNRRRPAGEDGRLYGIEVEGLDLVGTRLVVLSACQTALGDVNAGRSAAGLRQAFQLAGARSVIATLWSVEDAATTKLTIALTGELAGGAEEADALRKAQLELLAAPVTAHPYFWAAFTITEQGR